jgi:tetratricopeptide (TPR) repeat protein
MVGSIFVFFASFIIYLFTLAPSITVGDSGEFCAAGVILGLPHSPGYPLYCLLAKLFCVIIPWATYAFRVNIMSAVFASLSGSVLYSTIKKFTDDKIAVVSAFLFLFSHAFWVSAVQAEVFTLNTFFTVLIIYAVFKDEFYLSAFLLGLGAGNHHTLIFIVPFVLIELYRAKLLTVSYLLKMALFAAAGFSVYIYLPVRSFKNPGLDWGNPESIKNILRVIRRADYGSFSLTVGEKMQRTLPVTVKQLVRFSTLFKNEILAAGILAGIYGWYAGLKNRARLSFSLLATWLIAGPGFILLANMPFDSQTKGILVRFFILINLIWVFPFAWAVQGIMFHLRGGTGGTWGKRLVYAVVSLNIIILFSTNYAKTNWRGYFLSYDYGKNLLKTMEPGSVLFMDGGDDTFYSLAYFQFAEGRRKDIELHDRGGLVFKNPYGSDFRKLPKTEKEKRRQEVEKMYLNRKPVYYSTFNRDIMPGHEIYPDGILYKTENNSLNSWHLYSLRSVWAKKYYDYRSRALAPVYPYFAAYNFTPTPESHDESQGLSVSELTDKSMRYWNYIHMRWPEVLWVDSNLKYDLLRHAFAMFSKGLLNESKKIYNNLLAMYPDEVSALINLGVIEEKQNNIEKSKEYYSKALAVDPGNIDAYFNLAVLFWKESAWDEVIGNLKTILSIDPANTKAKHYLLLAEKKKIDMNNHRGK